MFGGVFPSLCVVITWGVVWVVGCVLSVGGVCGWVFMNPTVREGVCSENTQPHTPTKLYELTLRMLPRW